MNWIEIHKIHKNLKLPYLRNLKIQKEVLIIEQKHKNSNIIFISYI